MAYPFARAPSTAEFVTRLRSQGAELLTVPGEVIGPRGPVTIRYLKRIVDGEPLFSEPLADSDDEVVGWDKLRRVCRQLQVDPRDLRIPGLHLG